MTPDPTGFERNETAPPERTVEMGNGTLLSVAGYGDLRLKIEQDDADGGQTRELVLRRAAHVPGLGHNLLSAAQLSATFEHPMQLWPRAAVLRWPRDGQFVIFRKSARRLFEATARRSAIVDQASAKALVVAKPTPCDIMMIVAFMAKTSYATAVLRAIIARYFAPAGLNIGVVRTDNGGEFQGAFQSLLVELGIKHERTPPYTPQYNGVAERTLGLLRDKTVALLRGVTEGASERL